MEAATWAYRSGFFIMSTTSITYISLLLLFLSFITPIILIIIIIIILKCYNPIMIMLDDVDNFYDLLSSPHPPTQTRTHAAYCKQVSTSLSLARSLALSLSLPPSLSPQTHSRARGP